MCCRISRPTTAPGLGPLVDAVAEAMPLLVADDAAGFMTRVALILRPPPPKPSRAAPPDEGKA